jgi:exopolyphosphatase / guanosine-5'-triphosphate,3'-diphosphate pyrophosphatase
MVNNPVETYAAVDLGSNSFHMIVAEYSDGRIQIIDRIRKMVRLASGLDDNDNLSDKSIQNALDCLQEFGQRIREIPQVNVRAVGTNTLRQANNGGKFIKAARLALGHKIEIIAGREEARLIYLGVANSIYDETDWRMVIDIGGGSTEIIIGKGFDVLERESFYIGCVNMTRRFFESGEINQKNMNMAVLAVRQEIESIMTKYRALGWNKVIGASGTIRSVNDIIMNAGWSTSDITQKSLTTLKDEVISLGNIEALNFNGLSSDRKPVFIGGLAILCGIFDAFKVQQLNVSDGALREGLLYDLIGRLHDKDIRDSTISSLANRYSVDTEQASRVKNTAIKLFEQLCVPWKLDKNIDLKFIEWAAEIHEIGLAIAHAQYHRHGAYLVANSDLAGFSREEQGKLALLIRSHRRKYPIDEIDNFILDDTDNIKRLCILIRLAILLNRSRLNVSLPQIEIKAKEFSLKLKFPENWVKNNPLTRTDLDLEARYIKAAGFKLTYSSS